ncbi:hypothetical protein HDU87_000283 [Geranomyces variabilis]|uniref:Uncharacterized protein n=1 Tax=Geranomyces variabilis TaxID=109894 RepID=A0AAD5TV82_9FUNG|nr:hypothetical protein HDU87_000283 [Geranomyces variabilis]
MKVQQSVLRLAKLTEERQRQEADKRQRQQLRDEQARERILAMRKARHQSATPPWRLGAYSKPGSAIRPLITGQRRGGQRSRQGNDDEAFRHLLFQDNSASNPHVRGSLATKTSHGGLGGVRRMGAQSAPPGRSRTGDGQDEVLRIMDGPRPPSSGRSHLSYIIKHNGRDVRVVKGYAVEIRDMTDDGVVQTLSTPQMSSTSSLPTLPSSAAAATNPYQEKAGSSSSADPTGPKRAIILDLTPCPDGAPEEGAKDGDDPIMHGTYARESWVQSSKTQNRGVMRIRPASACVSSSGSSGTSGSRPPSSRPGRKASAAEKDEEEKPIFVRKESEDNAAAGGTTSNGGQQAPAPAAHPRGHRASILSSRPSSARPSSGRNITFAKDTQVIWDCDHRAQTSDDEPGQKGEGSDESLEATELAERTTSNTNSNSALSAAAALTSSTSSPSPSPTAKPHPPKPNRSPLSAPPRRVNLSALPTNFLSELKNNPRAAIPQSIRELLRKDALASQFLTLDLKARTQSAPPVRREMSDSNVEGDGNPSSGESRYPSRLPRWKSSTETRRAAIKSRVQIPRENVVKAWKSKDRKATTEVCLYAHAAPTKLPTPPQSRPSTQQYSRWSYENFYPGAQDDGSATPPNEEPKKTAEIEIRTSIEQLDRLLEPKLKRLSFADLTPA